MSRIEQAITRLMCRLFGHCWLEKHCIFCGLDRPTY